MPLPRLFVHGVLAAEGAVFFLFNPARVLLFILGGRIISLLAVRAFKRNDISHDTFSVMGWKSEFT
jgi:hypothetical protein